MTDRETIATIARSLTPAQRAFILGKRRGRGTYVAAMALREQSLIEVMPNEHLTPLGREVRKYLRNDVAKATPE